MALLPIDSLLTPKTADEIEAEVLDVATSLGLDVTSWQPFGVFRTLLRILAEREAGYSSLNVEVTKGGYLQLSAEVTPEGGPGWLDLVGVYFYNVPRIEATEATGNVTLTNASGVQYTGSAGDLRFANRLTGKTYVNTGIFTLDPLSDLDVDIQAEESGSDSDASAGDITIMVTPLLGVTCTNAAAVLGSDNESNAAYVLRCQQSLAAKSPNGPNDAYNYVAKSVPSGTDPDEVSGPITRAETFGNPTTGVVSVYIANSSGEVDAPDVAVVQDAIDAQATPVNVTATVESAVAVTQAFVGTIHIHNSTLTDAQVSAKVQNAIDKYLAAIPIGGTFLTDAITGKLYFDALIGVIFASDSQIAQATLSSPSGDVTLANNEIVTASSYTFTVIR